MKIKLLAASSILAIAASATAFAQDNNSGQNSGQANTVEQVDALFDALEASVTHLRRISVHA